MSDRKPLGYWTKERIAEKAKEFESLSAFRKGASGAYTAACRLGIALELFPNSKLRQKAAKKPESKKDHQPENKNAEKLRNSMKEWAHLF